jgi:glutamate synthase domain-containing protein 1
MVIWENGKVREMTAEEIAEQEAQAKAAECDYWRNTPYDEAVNTEIRKQYSQSQEFAILRQKDEKPEEYAQYFAYCENCKAYVKQKKAEYA